MTVRLQALTYTAHGTYYQLKQIKPFLSYSLKIGVMINMSKTSWVLYCDCGQFLLYWPIWTKHLL